jgi:hypothetical protein
MVREESRTMETLSDAQAANTPGPGVGLSTSPPADEPDLAMVAMTFAVTPEAARLAMARVGTDFRDLQRELGGRR